MITLALLLKLFLVGFILNVIWEFSHCWLYETCRRQTWRHNIPLLLGMALKDGFFIILFYLIATSPFSVTNILNSSLALGLFVALSISFSFLDEKISVHLKRWEYASTMPTIWGVGLTPLFEILLTGIFSFLIIF